MMLKSLFNWMLKYDIYIFFVGVITILKTYSIFGYGNPPGGAIRNFYSDINKIYSYNVG